MDFVANYVTPLLTAMFVIGAVGCVIVVPVVAYRLFSVLFQPDREGDQ